MSASLFVKKSKYNPTTNKTAVMIEAICDGVADLPVNDESNDCYMIIGSTAKVIDPPKNYMLKSNGTWIEQPGSGSGGGGTVDAYTKAETDALLEDKQPYDITNSITAPDDLDYYYQVGTWQGPNSGIENCPSSASFRLEVIEMPLNRVRQIIRTTGGGSRTYVRQSQSTPSGNVTALIPAMTSDTTPSGTVISSGYYQTRYSYYAFDGVDSQTWQSNAWGDGTNRLDGLPESCYVGYEFQDSVQINSYEISFSSDTTYVGIIQTRSNSVWTTQATVNVSPNGYSKVTGDFDETVTCDAVRFSVLSGTQPYFNGSTYGGVVCEFQVYYRDDKPTWSDWYLVTTSSELKNIYKLGEALELNDNINDFNSSSHCGIYQTSTRAIAESIIGRPDYSDASNKVFRLEQTTLNSSTNRFIQRMYVCTISGNDTGLCEIFERCYTSNGWGNWYQMNTTQVNTYSPQLQLQNNFNLRDNALNDLVDNEDDFVEY
jgi:hypothetical protein